MPTVDNKRKGTVIQFGLTPQKPNTQGIFKIYGHKDDNGIFAAL